MHIILEGSYGIYSLQCRQLRSQRPEPGLEHDYDVRRPVVELSVTNVLLERRDLAQRLIDSFRRRIYHMVLLW